MYCSHPVHWREVDALQRTLSYKHLYYTKSTCSTWQDAKFILKLGTYKSTWCNILHSSRIYKYMQGSLSDIVRCVWQNYSFYSLTFTNIRSDSNAATGSHRTHRLIGDLKQLCHPRKTRVTSENGRNIGHDGVYIGMHMDLWLANFGLKPAFGDRNPRINVILRYPLQTKAPWSTANQKQSQTLWLFLWLVGLVPLNIWNTNLQTIQSHQTFHPDRNLTLISGMEPLEQRQQGRVIEHGKSILDPHPARI